ncbi:hypothetical protein [Candidatus Electronema sp. JC]|uniref:hypothetical protein n=1 Tax=Candidatus Electronema sp. JC TaxID=3401570 RepID=UPI003AA88B9D
MPQLVAPNPAAGFGVFLFEADSIHFRMTISDLSRKNVSNVCACHEKQNFRWRQPAEVDQKIKNGAKMAYSLLYP